MRLDYNGRPVAIAIWQPGPVTINLTVASANLQLLVNAHYRLWSSVDCFIEFGTTSGVTAALTSHPLTAKVDYLFYTGINPVTGVSNNWIAAIVASGTGVLYISQLDALAP